MIFSEPPLTDEEKAIKYNWNNKVNKWTGKYDNDRRNALQRALIDRAEDELGRAVCGKWDEKTGQICTEPVVEGKMRCERHVAKLHASWRKKMSDMPKALPTRQNQFRTCLSCRDANCPLFIRDLCDPCPYEVATFKSVYEMGEKFGIAADDFLGQKLLEQTAMGLVMLDRVNAELAKGELIMKDPAFVSDAGIMYNRKANPLMSEWSRINTIWMNYMKELEATPKAKTGKGAVDASVDYQQMFLSAMSDVQKRREELVLTKGFDIKLPDAAKRFVSPQVERTGDD